MPLSIRKKIKNGAVAMVTQPFGYGGLVGSGGVGRGGRRGRRGSRVRDGESNPTPTSLPTLYSHSIDLTV